MERWLRRASALFASKGLGVVILILLLAIVLLGTLEQVNQGLYEVQKRYFESLFVVHWFGAFPLPLPGVYLLLALGFVNVAWGGILRAPKTWRRPGLIIAHLGVLALVGAGFVTHHFALNGQLTLYEGDRKSVV